MTCYIASGWFNMSQTQDLENIKETLSSCGVEYFSPKDECKLGPHASSKNRKRVFTANLDAIENSQFIIVNTRDKDMGTIFEAGYAYKCGVPIIYFCEGLVGNFNLMLAESGLAVATSRWELGEIIEEIQKTSTTTKKYRGTIE